MRPNRSTSAAERVDVAQPGGVAVACHHRPEQLGGPGPALHPPELALGVLTFGLGGVQPALASLRAVHLQLGGDLAQRLGGVVVTTPDASASRSASASAVATASGCAAGQLVADPGHQRLRPGRHLGVGLGLDGQLVVADGSAVHGEALPRGGQLRLRGLQLLLGAGRPHATLGEQLGRLLGDLSVRLAVADGLLVCRRGGVEFGAQRRRLLRRSRRRDPRGRPRWVGRPAAPTAAIAVRRRRPRGQHIEDVPQPLTRTEQSRGAARRARGPPRGRRHRPLQRGRQLLSVRRRASPAVVAAGAPGVTRTVEHAGNIDPGRTADR